MLAYYAKRSQGEEFEKLDRPLDRDVWISGSQLTPEEVNLLIKRYELAPNIVYDVRDRQELPRVEFAGSDAYIFLRLPRLSNSGHIIATPLLSIFQPHRFITMSMRDSVSPEDVAATTLPIRTTNKTELLLGVIAACIASYEQLLKHTERSINDIANRLRTHEISNQDFAHFVIVEDNLTIYRMNFGGMQAVVRRLKETNHNVTTEKDNEALEDLSLHLQQLLVAVESYAARVVSIQNAYSTVANHRLNIRMKTLTVLTLLVALPNVIFGMFGINVRVPFQDESWAFVGIVGGTALVVLLVYLIGKRLRIF